MYAGYMELCSPATQEDEPMNLEVYSQHGIHQTFSLKRKKQAKKKKKTKQPNKQTNMYMYIDMYGLLFGKLKIFIFFFDSY